MLGILSLAFQWGMIYNDFLTALGLFLISYKLLSILNNRIFKWLGEKSYYIFLYHEPALKMILMLLINLPI
jgi:peptidoglycan/LPS O-acetylase OafA/YrhL